MHAWSCGLCLWHVWTVYGGQDEPFQSVYGGAWKACENARNSLFLPNVDNGGGGGEGYQGSH